MLIKNTYKRKDGRWIAYCIDENGNPHTYSYPRILMEEKLGRPLKPYEDVHHKDENIDNNNINNLEIQIHGEHQRKHSTKYVDTIETCMICGCKFTMSSKAWSRFFADLSRKQKRSRILTCSKSCAGKASSGKYKILYNSKARIDYVKTLWLK